jgi:hypothetical protein
VIETVPPRRTVAIASVSARSRSTAISSATGLPIRSGSLAATFWANAATRLPSASMPTASMTLSGPRPPVASMSAFGTSSTARASIASIPCRRASSSRSGTKSTPNTRAAPSSRALRALSWPTGPKPYTATDPPAGMSA